VDLNTALAARVVDAARFAMNGVAPRMAWRPETADELAEAVRQCNADGLKLVPWGGGVSLRREPAPARYDVALDTTALKRVTIYDPEDLRSPQSVASRWTTCARRWRRRSRSCRSRAPRAGAPRWAAYWLRTRAGHGGARSARHAIASSARAS